MAETVNVGHTRSFTCTAVASVLATTSGINDRDLDSKTEQLNGQDYAGDRRVEGCRHARGRSARQQDFALRSSRVKYLPDEQTQSASSLNDGAFSAERAASADGNGGGNRFKDRHTRLNAAAIDQHRFHGFWNAVPFDLPRQPYFAITPTISPPITGIGMTHRPK